MWLTAAAEVVVVGVAIVLINNFARRDFLAAGWCRNDDKTTR